MYKATALLTIALTASAVLMPSLAAAQSASAKAMLILSPENANITVGDTTSVKVLVDTKGLSISQVDFKLKYDPAFFAVQDSDTQKAGLQIKDGDLFEVLLSTSPVNATTGVIQYSKIALSDSHYYTTSGQPATLATIDFKALKAGDTKITFDTATTNGTQATKVYKSSDETQVLGEVTNGEYTIKESTSPVQSTGSALPTATSSSLPTATATTTASPTVTAIATPTAKSALSMTLDKVSLKADGKDVAQVKATVKDGQGNALANAKVQFSITGSGLLSPTSAMTNAQGQATTSLTAGTQAGSVVINAHLDSDPTVSASSQISSVAVAMPTVTTTPRPTVTSTPTTRPTSSPSSKPVPVPNQLNQVGPASTLLAIVASALLSALYLGVRRKVTISVKQ